MEVFLEPESRLTGTVLDDAGKPVAGARIMLSWGLGEMMNVPIDEKDGRYLADGLGSGKYMLSVTPASARPLLHIGHAGGRQDARQGHPCHAGETGQGGPNE